MDIFQCFFNAEEQFFVTSVGLPTVLANEVVVYLFVEDVLKTFSPFRKSKFLNNVESFKKFEIAIDT